VVATVITAQPAASGPRLVRPEPPYAPARTSGPKILLYSHDTFGLGNIRRSLLLCQALRQEYADSAILLVTGSPVIHALPIPDGIDYIKLPCLDRVDAERYEPRFLSSWSEEVTRMRRGILLGTILDFSPDLMIVDKRAAGIDGELLDSLRALRRDQGAVKLVLGIRDILDEPDKTRRSLARNQSFATIERYYDEVWIYGERSLFDAVTEYGFPEAVARKTHYCGYLQREAPALPRPPGPPRVLVTTGGGGDGSDLIEAYLEGLADLPRRIPLQTTVVFGPQMPAPRHREMLERFGMLPDVTFVDFDPDLARRYAEADVVVCMAGYNTVCELLSFGRRAVLVPRGQPVSEQLLRARLFAARGDFEMVEPDALEPDALMRKVLGQLSRSDAPASSVDLGGLPRVVRRVRRLLTRRFA
jgi:predicted glycosyltransferase